MGRKKDRRERIQREWSGARPASSEDAVDMRMKLQALVPTVEHTEETDLGTKMPRVASNLKQRLGAGVKEQVVDQPLVLQRERRQFPR